MLAHHRARTIEFLAAHFIEGGARVLEHVAFVEDDSGPRQHGADGIEMADACRSGREENDQT